MYWNFRHMGNVNYCSHWQAQRTAMNISMLNPQKSVVIPQLQADIAGIFTPYTPLIPAMSR